MAYAETPAAPAQPAAAPAAPVPPATAELREAAAKAPTPADLAKGDPGGIITGSIADVTVTDAKAGPTMADAGNQIGQNKVAINFVWTLVCGFLVMFMQAGFAMVESGLTRVKNANHTYMMNFFVYGCGLLAYWLIGFAIQMGGAAGNANLGGLNPLNAEQTIYLWTMFDSKQRSAMKKEQARMKDAAKQIAAPQEQRKPVSGAEAEAALNHGLTPDGAAPDTITDAARKRLEARISELKIDREQVKQYISLAFGRAHFSELTKEEYRIVDSFVEIIGATTLDELAGFWKGLSKDDRITLTAAKNARKAALEAAQEPQV